MKDPEQYTKDDIRYAVENTKIHHTPIRRIETFGDSKFDFILITEVMDDVNVVRVRSGWVEAEKPKIISPTVYRKVLTEGFGKDAERFFDWMEKQGKNFGSLLEYGFRFRRSEVQDEILHESLESVLGRLTERLNSGEDVKEAIIEGVDDAWEVSLLQFAVEMVQKSHERNIGDFRGRGLL